MNPHQSSSRPGKSQGAELDLDMVKPTGRGIALIGDPVLCAGLVAIYKICEAKAETARAQDSAYKAGSFLYKVFHCLFRPSESEMLGDTHYASWWEISNALGEKMWSAFDQKGVQYARSGFVSEVVEGGTSYMAGRSVGVRISREWYDVVAKLVTGPTAE